jgi:hypothetical protein
VWQMEMKKVVSDVTSETTFSLKSISLMKRGHEGRMKGCFLAFLEKEYLFLFFFFIFFYLFTFF